MSCKQAKNTILRFFCIQWWDTQTCLVSGHQSPQMRTTTSKPWCLNSHVTSMPEKTTLPRVLHCLQTRLLWNTTPAETVMYQYTISTRLTDHTNTHTHTTIVYNYTPQYIRTLISRSACQINTQCYHNDFTKLFIISYHCSGFQILSCFAKSTLFPNCLTHTCVFFWLCLTIQISLSKSIELYLHFKPLLITSKNIKV